MAVDCVSSRSAKRPVEVRDYPIEEIVDHARKLGITTSGEMYSSRGLARLGSELWPELQFSAERILVGGDSDAAFERISCGLREGRPCIFP